MSSQIQLEYTMDKELEFYKKLKNRLEETSIFPTEYMFKFIIPKDEEKFKQIENVFNNLGAVISSKPSKTEKFISITVLVKMESADKIIELYKEVSKIEGVLSL